MGVTLWVILLHFELNLLLMQMTWNVSHFRQLSMLTMTLANPFCDRKQLKTHSLESHFGWFCFTLFSSCICCWDEGDDAYYAYSNVPAFKYELHSVMNSIKFCNWQWINDDSDERMTNVFGAKDSEKLPSLFQLHLSRLNIPNYNSLPQLHPKLCHTFYLSEHFISNLSHTLSSYSKKCINAKLCFFQNI